MAKFVPEVGKMSQTLCLSPLHTGKNVFKHLVRTSNIVASDCHVLVRAPGVPMSSNFSSNITQLALAGNRGWLLVCCVLFGHTQQPTNTPTFYSPCEAGLSSATRYNKPARSVRRRINPVAQCSRKNY